MALQFEHTFLALTHATVVLLYLSLCLGWVSFDFRAFCIGLEVASICRPSSHRFDSQDTKLSWVTIVTRLFCVYLPLSLYISRLRYPFLQQGCTKL
jgi:hypothetical protein